MLTRDEVKLIQAGKFAMTEPTIDKDKLLLYVEASISTYDLIMKKLLEDKKNEPTKSDE
jgi:hypothetical protein